MTCFALTLVLATGPTLCAAAAPPAAAVAGPGLQLQPSSCRLRSGTRLLAFEYLRSAYDRSVYVKRRRPGFGWSLARPVPQPKRDHAQRHPSLVCRTGDQVFLYVQVGNLARRHGAVRLYRAAGDSLAFVDQGRLSLGLPAAGATTEPFAAATPGGGVLLTVTLRHAGARDGCYLARSSNGIRFAPARRTGPGQRCRTVVLSRRTLVQTFQRRARRSHPFRAGYRISRDGGRSWGPDQRLSRLRETFDAAPVARSGGGATLLYVARLGRRTALLSIRLDPAGHRLRPAGRVTPWSTHRVLTPQGRFDPAGLVVLFAREVRPLDFDIFVQAPTAPGAPRPAPRR